MSDPVATSPSLLLRIRNASDHEAWSTFQEIYLPLIRSFCVHWGLQTADAEDVAQEVLVAVARTMPSFDYQPERGRFRAWLGTVTVNKIKSWYASPHVQGQKGQVALVDQRTQTNPSTDWAVMFSEHIFQTACQRVRSQCDPQTWHCFQATWIEHKDAPVVARDAGISVHTVYVNKSRVLQRLEKEVRMLAEDFPLDFFASSENSEQR